MTHPQYSDFTDIKNWNDTGVVILDAAPGLPTRRWPRRTTSTSSTTAAQPDGVPDDRLRHRGAAGRLRPQKPTPQRQPIVRRYTTEIGQKLTAQIFQTNGNVNDPRAGGGTCFGDSGGPAMRGGYVVGDTSYGFTNKLPLPRRLPAGRHPDRAQLAARLHRRSVCPTKG